MAASRKNGDKMKFFAIGHLLESGKTFYVLLKAEGFVLQNGRALRSIFIWRGAVTAAALLWVAAASAGCAAQLASAKSSAGSVAMLCAAGEFVGNVSTSYVDCERVL